MISTKKDMNLLAIILICDHITIALDISHIVMLFITADNVCNERVPNNF